MIKAFHDLLCEHIRQLQADCLCGGCVRKRGGGQHHNGPCAIDQERWTLPDGTSRQLHLRELVRELAVISTKETP